MENELSTADSNSIFQQLRDGISSISKSISDIEEKMKIPIVNMPENSALIETVEMASKVKSMKASAIRMKTEATKLCEEQNQYCQHMESVVKDMERSIENVTNRLKNYGYEPPTLPNDLCFPQRNISIKNNDLKLVNRNENAYVNDGENTSNANEHLLEKTPTLAHSGIFPRLNSGVKDLKIGCLFPSENISTDENLNNLNMDAECDVIVNAAGDTPTLTLGALNFVEKREEYTPDNEPLLRSLKKTIDFMKDKTPEDPTVSIYSTIRVEDSTPSTPKTPLLSFLRR